MSTWFGALCEFKMARKSGGANRDCWMDRAHKRRGLERVASRVWSRLARKWRKDPGGDHEEGP